MLSPFSCSLPNDLQTTFSNYIRSENKKKLASQKGRSKTRTNERKLTTSVCVDGACGGTSSFVLLLWFVFFFRTAERRSVPKMEATQPEGGSGRGQRSSRTSLQVPFWLGCRVSSEVTAVVRFSAARVSGAAVPVSVGEPLQVHQPRVQDLGVSTGYCETGGDTEEEEEEEGYMLKKNSSSTTSTTTSILKAALCDVITAPHSSSRFYFGEDHWATTWGRALKVLAHWE